MTISERPHYETRRDYGEPSMTAHEENQGPFVVAVDQGTTSTRAVAFDDEGFDRDSASMKIQAFKAPGGKVEQEPEDFVTNSFGCLEKLYNSMKEKGLDTREVKAVGVTNQRETTILFNTQTGRAIGYAVVWSDSRNQELVDEWKEKRPRECERIREITSLTPNTYFSAFKIRWLLDHGDEEYREVYEAGNLGFATVDVFMIYHLTGGVNGGAFVTEPTNASRTMLMDLKSCSWSEEAVKIFGFEKLQLPEIKSSSEVYGHVAHGPFKGVPVSGCLGDQSAALIGHLGINAGDTKNTYGTGCFLLCNTGETPKISQNGLITTLAIAERGKRPLYALEGPIQACGSAINWLRNMGTIEDAFQVGEYATAIEDNEGTYFVLALSGLFAPFWDPHVKGCIYGLDLSKGKPQTCRATIESVAYQARAILEACQKDFPEFEFKELKVDGGVSTSDSIMQIQADVMNITVKRGLMTEPTSLGAAIAAGLAVGVWKDLADAKQRIERNQETGNTLFKPQWGDVKSAMHFEQWMELVAQVRKAARIMARIDG